MKSVAATEARNRLGAILKAAQREPIVIRRQDRDIAVVMSMADYERLRSGNARAFMELRDAIAAEAAKAGLTDYRLAELLNGLGLVSVSALASNFYGVPRSTRDADFVVELSPHDQARFRRRQTVALAGRAVWIATPEDMIVTKLRWARDAARLKDRDDLRNMLAVQGRRLDWAYIADWTTRHGTADLLDEIRATPPESLR